MTIIEITPVPFSSRHRGGGEGYAWQLAAELGTLEKVTLCASVEPGDIEVKQPFWHVPARFFGFPPFLNRHNPVPTSSGLRVMRQILQGAAGEVEFVHVHNYRTAMGSAWLYLAQLNRKSGGYRILVTDHGSRWFPAPQLTSRFADYYIAVSRSSLDSLNRLAPRPSTILPPGIPSDYAGLKGPCADFESRDIDLLFLGRLAPWKRPDLVLKLASDLKARSLTSLKVVIAGSEVDSRFTQWMREEALRLGLGGIVEFLLAPSDDQAVALYRRAKLHVLLSSYVDAFGRRYPAPELSSTTVVEAAACGTPSLCSDLPAFREQVIPSVTGELCEASNWTETVSTAYMVLTDPKIWLPMSARARNFVERERTYQTLARNLSKFLDGIRSHSL